MHVMTTFVVLVTLQTAVDQGQLATDYPSAFRRAQAGDKPLLVLVTADWCAPCQMLKRTTVPEMKARRGFRDFHFAMVDVDRDAALAPKLTEGRPVPQFIVFERKGEVWTRRYSVGYLDADALQAFLAPSIRHAQIQTASSPVGTTTR